MAAPVTRIQDVAEELLAAIVTYHGGIVPDRQIVPAGPPAWDCEMVAVWCESTSSVDGGPELDAFESRRRMTGHQMRAGTFVISIVRCTPAVPNVVGSTVLVPTVDDENAAGRELHEDAQRVINALAEARDADELGTCNSIVFDTWTQLGPDGSYFASEQRVRVGLSTGL
jgi:hypothetical protein